MSAKQDARTQQDYRILLVEDHEDTLAVMVLILRKSGYDVTAAGGFTAGLLAGSNAKFDLLVTDLELRDGDGWTLFQRLKAQNADLVGVAVSGHGMAHHVRQSESQGFCAHLTKPIELKALIETIDRCIQSANDARVVS